MRTGRPSKYDPKYCDMLLEHAKEGKAFRSFAAKLMVSHDTLYEWCNKHEEFSDAKKIADALVFEWWENAGQTGMFADKFKEGIWKFNMANRFKWSDRVEEKVEASGSVTIEYNTED